MSIFLSKPVFERMIDYAERNEMLGERRSIEPFKVTIYISRKMSLSGQTDMYARGTGRIAFLDSGTLYDLKNHLLVMIALKSSTIMQSIMCLRRSAYASQERILIP